VNSLKTGDWITVERIRVYTFMILAFGLAAIVGVILTSHGGVDFKGRPLGTDFSNVWSAGRLVLDGAPEQAYDVKLHHLVQKATFNTPNIPYYGWHYPPFFLFVAAFLASLPYGWALLVWMGATFPLYYKITRSISKVPLTPLLIAAYPAVAVNLMHGQNGFVNAALLGAGLVWIDSRPVLSGFAIGLLAYKPQFGVLIPFVLMATGRWKVFVTATLTVVGLVVLSTLVFGMEIWPAFYSSTEFTRKVVLEAGALSPEKMLSIFSAFRMWGGSVLVAYIAQAFLTIPVVIGVIWLWLKPADQALKSAGLVTAALLVTPYALDYDLMLVALSIAWVASYGLKRGFLAWEKSTLALLWVLPLIARLAAIGFKIPLGLMALLLLFIMIIRRTKNDLNWSKGVVNGP